MALPLKPPLLPQLARPAMVQLATELGVSVAAFTAAEGVATRLVRRDGQYDSDHFMLILDTYHDRRNAYLFMTNPLGMRMPYANLRSHRKILVVDGRIGFTGGMNIRAGFVSAVAGANTASDTHFKVEGPVVLQLMSVFAHDWRFTTKESLPYEVWCSEAEEAPRPWAPARCVRSGPDRYIVGTHNMLLGAFAGALVFAGLLPFALRVLVLPDPAYFQTTVNALVANLLAVVLATINMVGGFVVTDRMLEMFGRNRPGHRTRDET